ncbi:MAG: rhodanese-like domain-containing protein [Saprospiraceae bacterium]|nr:rhodanese-like domain-containing protein [Saprospiraceae bacterium]
MKNFLLLLFLFAGILDSGCQKVQAPEKMCVDSDFNMLVHDYLDYTVPTISVAKLNERFGDYILLDAREAGEYEVSRIPGARLIGFNSPNFIALKSVPKNKAIVVYCSIGYRSEKVALSLLEKGYTNVFNLYGSIFEWVNQGLTLENDAGKTNDVHGFNKKWSKWILNKDYKVAY